MYYEKESDALNFIAGIAIGAVLGASIALLTAPQSGRRTRRHVLQAIADARESAEDNWEHVAGDVRRVVRKGRQRVRR